MGVSINTGASGGKKPVDAELNLVPFIDLLVCCICFLLITAVWTRVARIDVEQGAKNSGTTTAQLPVVDKKLTVLVGQEGYTLVSSAGDRLQIPKQGRHYDTNVLTRHLRDWRAAHPGVAAPPLTVAVEDGVSYNHMVTAMEAARRQNFSRIRVSDGQLRL